MASALFNDNKMKLGVFGPNVSHGYAATSRACYPPPEMLLVCSRHFFPPPQGREGMRRR